MSGVARLSVRFPLSFHLLLLALVVLGFGNRAIFLPEYWPPVRTTLIVHIIVTGGWFVFAVYKSNLVRLGQVMQHMRLGRFGVALALLVMDTGTTMIVELNLRDFSWFQVVSNAVNMVTFAIFFLSAIAWRKDAPSHKRMILFASLSLMTPAIARLMQPMGAEILTHPLWLLLCGAVAIHDLRLDGRVLRATWFGIAISLAGFAAFAATAVLSAGSANAQAAEAARLSDANGYAGRIRLIRFLDEPDGYCIDVPGGGDRIFVNMPAIAHTCHYDPLPDQVFAYNQGELGQIVWTGAEGEYCLTANSGDPGSGFQFAACDAPERQSFLFSDGGTFMLTDTDLCLAVETTGPRIGETATDQQDAYGRGRPVNPLYNHMARALVLAPCHSGDPSFQRWMALEN